MLNVDKTTGIQQIEVLKINQAETKIPQKLIEKYAPISFCDAATAATAAIVVILAVFQFRCKIDSLNEKQQRQQWWYVCFSQEAKSDKSMV